jgi:hypothetical protein
MIAYLFLRSRRPEIAANVGALSEGLHTDAATPLHESV